MKERPIIFSGEMVRAILDGRKTQTRRVVKQPKRWQGQYDQLCTETLLDDSQVWWWDGVHGRVGASQPCPYGQPGDRLWVRETWGKVEMLHLMSPTPGRVEDAVSYRAGRLMLASKDRPESGKVADWPASWSDDHQPSDGRWRPSIHMPRWASRILLEVTAVRVERLQDISEEDAWQEGTQSWMGKTTPWKGVLAPVSVHGFAAAWESINGPESWDANPWVWVVEFRRIEQESTAA